MDGRVDTAADEEAIGVFNKEAVKDEAQVDEAGATTPVFPPTSGMFRSQARQNHHNFTLVIAPIMNKKKI